MLDDVERMNQLASESQLDEETVGKLATMIDTAAAEQAQEDLKTAESDIDTSHDETEDEGESQRRNLTDVDAT